MQIDRVKLIAEMARQRLTVIDMTDRSGLSKATITAVRGGKSCTTSTGKAIAQALGVDVTELLEMKEVG